MKTQRSAVESLARGYTARHLGVSVSYVNKAIRGDRNGPTADHALTIYRKKLKELEAATELPVNQPAR